MDKVKTALAWLGKYHFWVLCVVVIVASLGTWHLASADLKSAFDNRHGELSSTYDQVRQISGETDHPNDRTLDTDQQKVTKLKKVVQKSWEDSYNEQKKNNKWPDTLTTEFLKFLETAGPEAPIARHFREEYSRFVLKYVPKLGEIVSRRMQLAEDGTVVGAAHSGAEGQYEGYDEIGGMGGGGRKGNIKWTGIVAWNQDFRQIEDDFTLPAQPTDRQVRLAQEDLWVYQALLTAIARTNEDVGAVEYHNAAIREIVALQIGRAAVAAQADEKAPILTGLGGAEDPSREMSSMPGTGGGATVTVSHDEILINNRYVDGDGNPLGSNAEQPFAEYKMMPIRMEVVIDQRRLPNLVTHLANANMRVRVRRVRVQPDKAPPANLDKYFAAAVTGGSGGSEGMSPMWEPEMGGGRDYSVGQRSTQSESIGGYHLITELHGIIFIFNPADPDKVGTGAAAQEIQTPQATTEPDETVTPEATPTEPVPSTPPADAST